MLNQWKKVKEKVLTLQQLDYPKQEVRMHFVSISDDLHQLNITPF